MDEALLFRALTFLVHSTESKNSEWERVKQGLMDDLIDKNIELLPKVRQNLLQDQINEAMRETKEEVRNG